MIWSSPEAAESGTSFPMQVKGERGVESDFCGVGWVVSLDSQTVFTLGRILTGPGSLGAQSTVGPG